MDTEVRGGSPYKCVMGHISHWRFLMTTTFHTVEANGLNIFYREAGDRGAPKLLLLGGFPASSHQFRNLLSELESDFHLVSFDYPGFGNTDMPDPSGWDYTFDHLADTVDTALQKIGFTGPMGFYMQDYGGPIGNRLIEKHPDWLPRPIPHKPH